jgi:DNA-binding GntR family transcriptional regulator
VLPANQPSYNGLILMRATRPAPLEFPIASSRPGRPRTPRVKRTLTSDLFDRIRLDILHCHLRPGKRLLFRDLRSAYGSGQSPLREALMRLVSEGLVILEDHKGFRVAPVSPEELVDIARTRCELEGLAVRMAIEKGDDLWEANIIARFHELSKRPTYTAEGKLDPDWERRHDAFHQALYAACDLRSLISFCQVLAERAYRYRHLLLESVDRTRDHRGEHEAIQKAIVNRDGDTGVALLQEHYRRTVQTLVANWREFA